MVKYDVFSKIFLYICIQISMDMKKIIFTFIMTVICSTVCGQCRYCTTYEDFMEDRWQQVDTIYCKSHQKSRQVWIGGNDYTLSSDDKAVNKILKKEAFAVMLDDTLYVNCRNLRYEKTRFGGGYTRARRIGERSLLFVNKMIGREAQNNQVAVGFFFGAVGGVISASNNVKKQVCYVISDGANSKGHIVVRMIDDNLMNQMIGTFPDLYKEYYAEGNTSKRILAKHVIPILEKAGLFMGK